MASEIKMNVYWKLAWYARLLLTVSNWLRFCGISIIPAGFVKAVVMNNWKLRVGETGRWEKGRLTSGGVLKAQ